MTVKNITFCLMSANIFAPHGQALAELSQHQRTSASLQLQRAMLLANEQLAQSTEDLSAGRAALRWNRFTHSQDSLDKVSSL